MSGGLCNFKNTSSDFCVVATPCLDAGIAEEGGQLKRNSDHTSLTSVWV